MLFAGDLNQGDEEKLIGIPVGLLNDREKVNKEGLYLEGVQG